MMGPRPIDALASWQLGGVRSNDPSERRSGVPPGCSEASRRAVAWSGTFRERDAPCPVLPL